MTIKYNEKVMEHFRNPRNVGELESADGFGEQTSDICGDLIHLFIKVDGDRISDIKYLTLGCAASIASGSILTEMVKGKTIEEAQKITKDEIVNSLGGLPEEKIHCSVLAADALHKAIEDYKIKHKDK